MDRYKIVPFGEEHIKEAAEIERICFSEPWSADAMKLLCGEDYPSLVALSEGGEVCGYIGSARALDEAQIINVAVGPEHRRHGVASALLSEFEGLCQKNGIASVSLEVRVSNSGAIALYESFGYERLGLRKRFYRAPSEDALVMGKTFSEDF